jgi:hypothetical protein
MRFLIFSLNRSGGLVNRKKLMGSDVVALSPNIVYANNFTSDISGLTGVRLSPLLTLNWGGYAR